MLSAFGRRGLITMRTKAHWRGEPFEPPEQIEREYLDAKARYQAQLKAQTEWDKRSGAAPFRRKLDEAYAESRLAREKLSTTKPTTAAVVAALIEYVVADLEDECCSWHVPAVRAAARALAEMPTAV
jgi:hypothetical protein